MNDSLSKPTQRRFRLAKRLAHTLKTDPRILLVLATGSVARNRCSDHSDLDLAVVTADSGRRRSVTSENHGEITVDIEWITKDRARTIVKGGKCGMQELREASRVGLGMVVFDRVGLAKDYRATAMNLRPAQELIDQYLGKVVGILSDLMSRKNWQDIAQWETFRLIFDNLAVILLLMNPWRYHKPKWVIRDLIDSGNGFLQKALLEAYGIRTVSLSTTERIIRLAEQFLDHVGTLHQLPTREQVIKLGFTRKYGEWSFICRTLEDAKSLVGDGLFEDAQYTAKFSARMALALGPPPGKIRRRTKNFQHPKIKARDSDHFLLYKKLFGLRTNQRLPSEKLLNTCLVLTHHCLSLKEQLYKHP